MQRILLGFILCAGIVLAGSPFYMKQDRDGFPCAMQRHFPRDRVVFCSADASSVLQLVQMLNAHGFTRPLPVASPDAPEESNPAAK